MSSGDAMVKGRIREEKVEKIEEDKNISEYNKQTKSIVIIMAIILASFLAIYWIVQENKKFEYNGMEFYKEREGSILFYKSLLGYATVSGESIPFVIKLRNDPRELEKVPLEGDIKLRGEVVLSLSPSIMNCSDTYITLVDFSRTLKAFGIKANAATTDKDYAKEHNVTLADCRSSLNKTVIVLQEGNETKISQEKIIFKDCYIIEIENCEIQKSFERFILSFIEMRIR